MEGLAGRDLRRNARLDLMETTRPRHALLCSSRAPQPSRDRDVTTTNSSADNEPSRDQRFRITLDLNLFIA